MRSLISVLMFLCLSLWANAAEILFSSLQPNEVTSIKDIVAQERVLSVNGEGSSFIIKTKSSTLVVPLINEQEVECGEIFVV